MSGTLIGGRRAATTNILKYGEDFYRNIGRSGGKKGLTGGFASGKVGTDGLTGPERAKKYAQLMKQRYSVAEALKEAETQNNATGQWY